MNQNRIIDALSKKSLRLKIRIFFCAALFLTALSFSTSGLAADWLQWGGPNGDFTLNNEEKAEKLAEDSPKRLWERPLGEGYSSILYKDN